MKIMTETKIVGAAEYYLMVMHMLPVVSPGWVPWLKPNPSRGDVSL